MAEQQAVLVVTAEITVVTAGQKVLRLHDLALEAEAAGHDLDTGRVLRILEGDLA